MGYLNLKISLKLSKLNFFLLDLYLQPSKLFFVRWIWILKKWYSQPKMSTTKLKLKKIKRKIKREIQDQSWGLKTWTNNSASCTICRSR